MYRKRVLHGRKPNKSYVRSCGLTNRTFICSHLDEAWEKTFKFSICSFHRGALTQADQQWWFGFISWFHQIHFCPFLSKQQKLRLKTADTESSLCYYSYNFYFAPRILQCSPPFFTILQSERFFLICNRCRQSIWSTVATCWTMLVYLLSIHVFTWSCSCSAFFNVYDRDLLFWFFLSQTLLQEILKVAQTLF